MRTFFKCALFAGLASAELKKSEPIRDHFKDNGWMYIGYTYWHTFDDATPENVTFYETWHVNMYDYDFILFPEMKTQWWWCDREIPTPDGQFLCNLYEFTNHDKNFLTVSWKAISSTNDAIGYL